MEFNSVSNKAMANSHIVLDGVTGLDFYLVDLSMGSIELSCTEIWHHDGSPSEYFDSDDNKISEEEYNRISNEMNNLFGSGGYWLEQNYTSVDEAFQAYMSNKGSIPASNSTSATNASESAGTAISNNASASEYILKDSSSRYLTKDDLQGFSADDCRIARNEIYARHGRKFDDEGLQSHFNSCSWYQGTIAPRDFDETMLSDIEIANKNLIVEYEKEKGYRQ